MRCWLAQCSLYDQNGNPKRVTHGFTQKCVNNTAAPSSRDVSPAAESRPVPFFLTPLFFADALLDHGVLMTGQAADHSRCY
jgi:hypothetical protein